MSGEHFITGHEQVQLNRACYFRFFGAFLASKGSYYEYIVSVSKSVKFIWQYGAF